MIYQVIRPCDQLKDLISHFWAGNWDMNSQQPNKTHYVIASSLTELTFAFHSHHKQAELLYSSVQGHTHLPNQFSVNGFYHQIGVALYSHAMPVFFTIPASELNRQFISLDTFLGRQGLILNEKIAMASDTRQRIQLLSNYFISILQKKKQDDQLILNAIKTIRTDHGRTRIDLLANDFCLSQKQFGRRFKEFSGFSPKTYSRIIRFESFIKSYSDRIDLNEIALANDYYDQAHFNHEFKSFTGFAPRDFWKIAEDTA